MPRYGCVKCGRPLSALDRQFVAVDWAGRLCESCAGVRMETAMERKWVEYWRGYVAYLDGVDFGIGVGTSYNWCCGFFAAQLEDNELAKQGDGE